MMVSWRILNQLYLSVRRCSCRYMSFGGRNTGGKKSKKYSQTLNLPKTAFPISMKNAASQEILIQKNSDFLHLYNWQRENNYGAEFILHDGPPYANGKPHVGHAINKILKDITNRYHMLRGRRVHYVPGWDCHGLPIELKALQKQLNKNLTPLQIRDTARKFAKKAIQMQMESFQRWGVMADWEKCYYTFDPQYQVNQLDVFYKMYEKGLVYIDVMPVYWSPSSKTALAESELEYNTEHVSTAVYVRFPVTQSSSFFDQYTGSGGQIYAVIWTTTPWTLPANQAICYSNNIQYVLLKDSTCQDMYICEESFVEKFSSLTSKQFSTLATFQGKELEGMVYKNPLTDEELPFLHGGHVTGEKGTGLVHTAPSHGHDDFKLAKECDIQIKSLVDDTSCYTEEAGQQLHGIKIGPEAEEKVISLLGDKILHKSGYTHSYPYDWRTKKPVIIRASRQWFIDTQKIKDRAEECLKDVEISPASSSSSLALQLDSRKYWCISRQRVWGVPIPVFYHVPTQQPLLHRATFEHVRSLISAQGSDGWWSLPDEELLPTSLLQQHGLGKSEDYQRGQDILDIWFDSGTSWATLLGAGNQADIYMEGTDQFRGWFQSSFLTSVAVQDKPPFKKLVAHGFTMDEEGRKMSKSLGNVVDPNTVISGGKDKKREKAYGADVLRWWAAFSNLQPHTNIGPVKLNRIFEDIYQLRKTLRFLLGNISDESTEPLLDYNQLLPQDRYMLHKLHDFGTKVNSYYQNMEYTKLLQMVEKFCKDEISSSYAVQIKDRCYCSTPSNLERQSSLTTQFYVLDTLTRSLAPIVPHLAEELYQYFPPGRRKDDVNSIFKTGWFDLPGEWRSQEILTVMEPALDIRDHLHDVLNTEPTMEFDVMIYTSNLLFERLQALQSEHTSFTSPLCELLQTASATLTKEPLNVIPDDVQVVNGICNVLMKDGYKCPEKYVMIISDTDNFICERCRRFTARTASKPCSRCMDVLTTGWD